MTIKEIFFTILKNGGYDAKEAEDKESIVESFKILEPDREKIFHIMYGDKLIEGRGTKKIKEHIYRFIEAEKDVQAGYIPGTMYYLLTQIKIGNLRLEN